MLTVRGCEPLPQWDPWGHDASQPDRGALDAGADTSADAGGTDVGFFDQGTPDMGAPDQGPPQGSLEGVWASQVINVQLLENQFVEVQEVVFTSINRVEIKQAGEQLTLHTQVCDLKRSRFGSTDLVYPSATIASLEPTIAFSSIMEPAVQSELSWSEVRLMGWVQDPNLPPEQQPIPESADDPRVVDADNDNNPGVTLQISSESNAELNGDIYSVGRSAIQYLGVVSSLGRIEGFSQTQLESITLGASNPVLTLGETTATPHPDAPQSTFVLLRVADDVGCEAIVQLAEQIF